MLRGHSFRSDRRVPTHIAIRLGEGGVADRALTHFHKHRALTNTRPEKLRAHARIHAQGRSEGGKEERREGGKEGKKERLKK